MHLLCRPALLVVCICLTLLAIQGTAFATQCDFAGDFSTTNNPNGQWAYGYLTGETFTAYTVADGSTGAPGSSSKGWHTGNGWDQDGNFCINLGPYPIADWNSYREVNQLTPGAQATTAEKSSARWTCPAAGSYYIGDVFSEQSTASWKGYTTVQVQVELCCLAIWYYAPANSRRLHCRSAQVLRTNQLPTRQMELLSPQMPTYHRYLRSAPAMSTILSSINWLHN